MSYDNFLFEIEVFLRKHNLSATQFGALAVGDTKFVRTVRQGRRPREKTQAAVRRFMRSFRGRR